MSQIKNDGLDQYGVGPFERQKSGTAGVEGVKDVSWVTKPEMRLTGGSVTVYSRGVFIAVCGVVINVVNNRRASPSWREELTEN